MANEKNGILVLLLVTIPLAQCGVPVLIWESSAPSEKEEPIPALAQLDTDEFSNHIVKKVHSHKPLIVLFLEESLSAEDFSWKDDSYRGAFPQVQNITTTAAKAEYLPSVEDPAGALRGLLESQEFSWEKYEGKKLPGKKGVILEVRLEDARGDEDRPRLLRRHDGDMADIYSRLLAQHSRVVALLTGRQSAWLEPDSNRVRREVEQNNNNETETEQDLPQQNDSQHKQGFEIRHTKLLMQSSRYPKLIEGTEVTPLSSFEPLTADMRDTYMRLPIKFKNGITLRFRFDKKGDDWELAWVEYLKGGAQLEPLKPTLEISAERSKSFQSYYPVEFKNSNTSLVFDDLQVEPWPALASEFSPPEDKDQFFTATIWSGLFVTFILALIFTWGITMLLDVRTMDRFDDPKGKTISVNVNE